MPISGDQNLNKDDPDYGLPLDTQCVGLGGPSPMEAAVISKSVGKSPVQTGGKIPAVVSGLTGGN